jgi:hypothetical protein
VGRILAATLLVALLAHCSSFSGDGASAGPQTGILCGHADEHCAIGETCCLSGVGDLVCAKDCSKVTFPSGNKFPFAFACGRDSDCAGGQECCLHHSNGNQCSSPYYGGSTCVAKGNCPVCPAGGNEKACDPARSDECAAPATCTFKLGSSIWTACSH